MRQVPINSEEVLELMRKRDENKEAILVFTKEASEIEAELQKVPPPSNATFEKLQSISAKILFLEEKKNKIIKAEMNKYPWVAKLQTRYSEIGQELNKLGEKRQGITYKTINALKEIPDIGLTEDEDMGELIWNDEKSAVFLTIYNPIETLREERRKAKEEQEEKSTAL
jgi:hypothetical protein